MVTAIVGANWGDEGKGKVTDVLAEQSDMVVRFQGGANAGHTIINEYGKFALHLLPSGVFHQRVVNIIGPGVALNIEALLKELHSLEERGVPAPQVKISDRCQVLLPVHIDFDRFEEERLGKQSFGSTKSGIAPFYADKSSKVGIQVCMLYDEELLRERVHISLVKKNCLLEHLYHRPPVDEDALVAHLLALGETIRPMVCDTTLLLAEAERQGKRILLEGQLHPARPGPRHLSLHHVLLAPGGLRLRRRGRQPQKHHGRRVRHQSVFQRCRRGALRDAPVRSGGRRAAPPRRRRGRVRRHHGPRA